ncbi:hypothetical protein HW532_18345 [Kaustia mangrovi]|uniref:Uncharacterized protein n=1 Tax=Kaustia mangrovi TaxID=2593653 RepID=A0A7S8C6V0_9HYPH|nr:hypothetical protein [Kaustia mangrovi]QPC44483.1 hypothetical protein HW532_18345 [Kaustia mangrovi]
MTEAMLAADYRRALRVANSIEVSELDAIRDCVSDLISRHAPYREARMALGQLSSAPHKGVAR